MKASERCVSVGRRPWPYKSTNLIDKAGRTFPAENIQATEMSTSTCSGTSQRQLPCHVGAHGGSWIWTSKMLIAYGELCPDITVDGTVSQTRRNIQIFLEIFMPEVKLNFIWTRDMLMCTERGLTQELLAGNSSNPELSEER